MTIAVIGAGASGMAAALAAAEGGGEVVLLERQARVGRKLLATGNGRCNLSNLRAGERGYHGADPGFVRPALALFPPEETLNWFRKMGLYTVAEPSGRVYPYSDQANSVVDILRFGLERENVRVKLGFEAERVRRTSEGFLIESREERLSCQRLIVACGGLAGSKLGGGLGGYRILKSLGHSCGKLRPSLVQLKSDWKGCVGLKGVRANCRAQILRDGAVFAQNTGEIQFTEYGLSGPVIFEISRDVCQGKGQWQCRLDFVPEMKETELEELLSRRSGIPASELLTGILHNRLGRIIVQWAGIRGSEAVESLNPEQLWELCRRVKSFDISLTEPMGMDAAQVTAGGMDTREFDPETMESRLVPGLYACGEVLDIDGDCGGFNLQWAWSSGRLAGARAAMTDTEAP